MTTKLWIVFPTVTEENSHWAHAFGMEYSVPHVRNASEGTEDKIGIFTQEGAAKKFAAQVAKHYPGIDVVVAEAKCHMYAAMPAVAGEKHWHGPELVPV